MLEKSCANYEDFAFKFKAQVVQQDEALADELEKLEKHEKPDASTSATQFFHTRDAGDKQEGLPRTVHARAGERNPHREEHRITGQTQGEHANVTILCNMSSNVSQHGYGFFLIQNACNANRLWHFLLQTMIVESTSCNRRDT